MTIGRRQIHKNEMSTPSGNSSNNENNSFKMTLPVLTKEYGYSHWKYDLTIWEALALLKRGKQGLAVFLSLIGLNKKTVRTISVENLSSVNGVNLIIAELDKLYLKNESSLACEAYEEIKTFSKPHKISTSDYVIKFKQLHHKTEVLDRVLAYSLNNTKLPKEKKQLVSAMVNEMKYEIMKEQLKKLFSLSFGKGCREEPVMLEQ